MTTTPLPTITFETSDCGRCAGSGMYGPISIDGGRCFSCHGSGIALTRAGRIARKRYDAIIGKMHVRIDEVRPGDRIELRLSSATKYLTNRKIMWYTVKEMLVTDQGSRSGGVPVLNYQPVLEDVDTTKWVTGSYVGHDHSIKVWNRDIYLEAINACRKLKGATITDHKPVVIAEITELLKPVVTPVIDRIATATTRVRGSHANCDHETTPAARRRCRASRA